MRDRFILVPDITLLLEARVALFNNNNDKTYLFLWFSSSASKVPPSCLSTRKIIDAGAALAKKEICG